MSQRFSYCRKPSLATTYIIVEEIIEDVPVPALPEEISWHDTERAGIVIPQAAGGDEQRDGHWDGQVDGEGKTESLDTDFASKFTWKYQQSHHHLS